MQVIVLKDSQKYDATMSQRFYPLNILKLQISHVVM